MDDDEVEDLEPNDYDLFDITDTKISYERSKDLKRVCIIIKDQKEISEMKLYLILGLEIEKLEKRLGISDVDPSVRH